MNVTTIGDLSASYILQQRSAELRADIDRLSEEVTTGVTADVEAHLGGDYHQLSEVERQLKLMDSFDVAHNEAAAFTETAQLHLEQVTETVADLSNSILSLGASPASSAVSDASNRAQSALEDAMSQLNGSYAGRSLFSGVTTDTAALISAQDLLDELRVVAGGSGNAIDAMAAIDQWFADPAGYDAVAYGGSEIDLQPFALSENRNVKYGVRADDPAIRDAVRDIAVAALASDPALGLSAGEQAELINMSGERLLRAQDELIALSAELGVTQEQIERASVRQEAERFTLETARNALLQIDTYQAATELETVQFQLESLYSVTVRNAELSLVHFL